MNCQLCQNELDAYLEGTLPEGTGIHVEEHLKSCSVCFESFQLLVLANKVMVAESKIQSNPFLVTRIMSGIEEMEQKSRSYQPISAYQKVLRPILISASLAAAIFTGVLVGSAYLSTESERKIPVELSYMDDASLESVDLFSQL